MSEDSEMEVGNEREEFVDIARYRSEDKQEEEILEDELQFAINKLKVGKTGGLDKMTNEHLKAGGQTLLRELLLLFNACLKNRTVPDSWLNSKLILLFKKGDKREIKNYRPINLLSVLYKTFMSIITKRMTKNLDFYSATDQVGFKKNFSTCDAILVIKELIAKAHEYQFPLFLLFIDFEKAFDSVYTKAIIKALEANMIDQVYTDIITYIYKKATIKIEFGGEFKTIKMEKGLRQGDVPSAKLFAAVLEQIFCNLEWTKYGINVNGEKLNKIKFADDLVLIGKTKEEVENMFKELIDEAGKVGLKINFNKTKLMVVNGGENEKIEIQGKVIETVEEIVYLGQLIGKHDGMAKELKRRITIAWRAYNRYRKLFRSTVDIKEKIKLWNSVVKPVITYASETWCLTKGNLTTLRVSIRRMERSMLGISRTDRKSNKWIREKTKLEDIGKIVLERKWKWAGHLVRTVDDRWSRRILDWAPREFSRRRGRPKNKWDEEMRVCCGGTTWKRVAMDRLEWKRMGSVYTDEWMPKE